MKRDPQLIRQILLQCEEHEHGYAPVIRQIEGFTEEQTGFHIHLLGEAGYMKVIEYTPEGSESPLAYPVQITHSGYEFFDAIRDEEVWKNTKNIIAKTDGWTLSVIASVATEIIKQKAMAMIGSP